MTENNKRKGGKPKRDNEYDRITTTLDKKLNNKLKEINRRSGWGSISPFVENLIRRELDALDAANENSAVQLLENPPSEGLFDRNKSSDRRRRFSEYMEIIGEENYVDIEMPLTMEAIKEYQKRRFEKLKKWLLNEGVSQELIDLLDENALREERRVQYERDMTEIAMQYVVFLKTGQYKDNIVSQEMSESVLDKIINYAEQNNAYWTKDHIESYIQKAINDLDLANLKYKIDNYLLPKGKLSKFF